MKSGKNRITYVSLVVLAAAIALMVIYFEVSVYGKSRALLLHFISDGFFASAVFYLGFGLLTFISEAGNFYGMQYLGYTLVHLFSTIKDHEEKKDFYSYCLEKRERQKAKKSPSIKWILILIGLVCLAISILSAVLYSRMYHAGL